MEQTAELIWASISATGCAVAFLMQRYKPYIGWRLFKLLALGLVLEATNRFSRAFDPPHQTSLRFWLVTLAGFVIAVLLFTYWERVAKKVNSGA